jgi:hypothetical protein
MPLPISHELTVATSIGSIPMSVLIEFRQIFMSTSRIGKSRVLQPPTLRYVARKSNEKFREVSDEAACWAA